MQQQDAILNDLKNTIYRLKDEKNNLMTDIIAERKQLEAMTNELLKMKKQKSYLEQITREKNDAIRQYDRIIGESERTLQKLSESTKKLLLSVQHTSNKFFQR